MRFVLCFGFLFGSSLAAAEDAAELARRLPESANTLAVVRVASIWGTSRAQAEHWYDKHEERFLGGSTTIPPWVETLVVASLVHPAVPEEVWSAALAHRPETITLEAIAEHEGTSVGKLADMPAVRTRRDSYYFQPAPNLIAAYRPAEQLEASRWARALAEDRDTNVSTYLLEAASREGHVVLALDLQDLLDEKRVEQLLMQDERFAAQRKLVERLIPLLAGLRGVTFVATIGDTTQATVDIDFSANVGPSSLSAKTLFVSILDDLGAAIDEFADSKVTSVGSTVTLSCQLSDESLRRILSLIVTPSAPYHSPQTAAGDKIPPQLPPAAEPDPQKATRKYFEAVNGMIDDLQRANRRAKDYARTAAWHDNFARKILELPMDGVDPQMLNYGRDIAARFRALAASLRGQAIAIDAQQRTLTYDVNYQPGWASVSVWGGVGYGEPAYNVSSNLQQVRENQAAAVTKGADERSLIWQYIEDDRTAMSQQVGETNKR